MDEKTITSVNETVNGASSAGTRTELEKTITEKIDKIIKTRKETLLPQIRNKIKAITEAIEKVEELDRLKVDVLDEKGEPNKNSKYYKLFKDNPEMAVGLRALSTDSFKKKADSLLEKYRELERRFDKDYINISVVGEAGAGKSRLLQSLTGLDNRCIPSFSGDHCTGASSTIENSGAVGKGVEVIFTFKSEYELLEEINEYVKEISGPDSRIMSLNGIADYYNKVSGLDVGDTHKNSLKNNFRERYVDNYSEWKKYIGSEPITLTDEDEIMTFVAQNNGKMQKGKEESDYKKFYKYIAVKQARIKKKFNYDDAGKIRFIDTVGLGDTALGDEKKMYEVIGDKSDSIIYFIRPRQERGKKLSAGETNMLSRVTTEFKKRNIEKWMSMLINKVNGDETQNNYCEYIKKELDEIAKDNSFMRVIVDASNEDDVREKYLIPMLNEITINLPLIDDMRVKDIKDDAEAAYDAYRNICRIVSDIIKNSVSGSGKGPAFIYNLINETYDGELTPALRKMNKDMGDNKGEICDILKEKIDAIVDTNNMLAIVPDKETIKEYYNNHGSAAITEIYSHFLDVIRSEITRRFIEVDASIDELINEFKNKITKILIDKGLLGKIIPEPDSGETFEWLKEFKENQLSMGDYKQLIIAFDFLYSFSFTVRGTMMNKVRTALYSISTANPAQLANVDFSGDMFDAIYYHLMVAVNNVNNDLQFAMKSFYISPNEAMFAVSDEFFDRITRADGVREEWIELYSENVGNIWYDKIAENAQKENNFRNWTNCLESLNEYNKRANFIMSIK